MWLGLEPTHHVCYEDKFSMEPDLAMQFSLSVVQKYGMSAIRVFLMYCAYGGFSRTGPYQYELSKKWKCFLLCCMAQRHDIL